MSTAIATLSVGTANTARDFLLARVDGVPLLIDQAWIAGVQVMEGDLLPGERPGVFLRPEGDGVLAVVAPTRRLTLAAAVPPACRFLFVLASGEQRLGVACESLQALHGRQAVVEALPAVMGMAGSSVLGVVALAEQLVFLCHGGRLLACLHGAEA